MDIYEFVPENTIIFFLHGLRGHDRSHEAALTRITKETGVKIVSLTLPGHGKDVHRTKCMVPRYQKIVDEVVVEIMNRVSPDQQIILMGYSFGGSLAILVADELLRKNGYGKQVVGVVGVNVAFHVDHNVPGGVFHYRKTLAKLSRFCYNKIPFLSRYLGGGEIDLEEISADSAVQEYINGDDLVYKGEVPLFTILQVHEAGVRASHQLQKHTMWSTLLLHSYDDPIALPYKKPLHRHITQVFYEGLRHNCLDGRLKEAHLARCNVIRFIIDKL